ncbi:DUF1028 domain-containing protein [Thermomicrobium sp. 4228-Ro]|uniref:DUF1028 domain-containing protein n=1 Tax=Thermomicrobium sp. 4228-Ro TaxID=2993937 RepID=UPI0022498831|nr:DUF1028 domain-containing protein [Thermomicrobium sp. 4228-Ro]MCX2728088.1 DUF1028 domain-containing protein [Thermomicrobium sp. 4228-Ro]
MQPSTFSIVAVDLATGELGVAVASKFLAVGAVVPWARAGVGAVATQSYANVSYGPTGLELMAAGYSAGETLARLLADDPERELRQVGIVDARGGTATFTGSACHAWAGGRTGPGYAVQGNILTGPEVVDAMVRAFEMTEGPLAARLLAALAAGDAAGGDRRGKQSAALLVVKERGGYGGYTDRFIDLRVDDHPEPVAELQRLYGIWRLYFEKPKPEDRLPLEGAVLVELQELMRTLGYYQGPAHGQWDEATRRAYTTLIGNENFEERIPLDADWIDRAVLEYLRDLARRRQG